VTAGAELKGPARAKRRRRRIVVPMMRKKRVFKNEMEKQLGEIKCQLARLDNKVCSNWASQQHLQFFK
jgi:hypothetical protein